MNCMKCGRETAEDQVFCAGCLEEMERTGDYEVVKVEDTSSNPPCHSEERSDEESR